MDAERYQRQIALPGFGEASQRLLSNAKVLVIGAGGLGCPAMLYLAAAGIGFIGIADDDVIALSNLHRQVLFTTDEVDKLKVQVASERLERLNPDIEIISHPVRIQKENVLDLIKGYDFILDGTDNFGSRYLINDACTLLAKPLIFAAVSGFEGQLAVFNVPDEKGMCCNYRDIFPAPPRPGEIANCAENGVLGVLPGIIGTMAAAETIKLITGIGRPLINKLLHYNLLESEQYEMNISPGNGYIRPVTEQDFLNIEYPGPSETEQDYLEIDTAQLEAIQQVPSTIVIDVRERHEHPKLDEAVFKKVPMTEFNAFLNRDIAEKNIVFICQHGVRSVAAAEATQKKYGNNKNIYSLKGGIVKWRNYFL